MEIHIYSINVLPFILVNLVFTSTKTDATCTLPEDLRSSSWEYNYTDVSDNSEKSKTLVISTTTLQNSVISLSGQGTTLDDWTCINNLTISRTEGVVVFKSDSTFSDGPSTNYRLYLCMKFTKVTPDLYYFYLLSDISTAVTPHERVFVSDEGNPPGDDAPMCSTFCKYTGSPKIRTLRRPETRDEIPDNAALCEPCDSTCQVDRCDPNPCQNNGSCVDFKENYNCTCTDGWRGKNCTTDAACTLPEDLRSSSWEYNYTDVSDNSDKSKTLVISTTTLQNSVISLSGQGTTLDDWTCINSLTISSTEGVVVFKSDSTFSIGIGTNYRLYLCMKFTKVTPDLYCFYLLSDIYDIVNPDERTFATSDSLADDAPICSTFCQYTEKPKIRTLRKPGTHDVISGSAPLCACASSCIVHDDDENSSEVKDIVGFVSGGIAVVLALVLCIIKQCRRHGHCKKHPRRFDLAVIR